MTKKRPHAVLGVLLGLGLAVGSLILYWMSPTAPDVRKAFVRLTLLFRGLGGPERARLVIEPKFDDLGPGFSEGLMVASSDSQWCYFDRAGKCVIDLRAKDLAAAWPFHEGMAKFKQGDKYGFLDREGHVAIPAKHDDAWFFSEGMVAVKLGERWGFLDKTGKEVIPFRYADAEPFFDGLAGVHIGGSVRGRFDSDGETIRYVMDGGRGGYIDRAGRVVIEPDFDWTDGFVGGFAKVNVGGTLGEDGNVWGGKWGLIDKTGALAVNPVYDSVGNFEEGLAPVQAGQMWGYIDTTGKQVIQPRFADGCHFSEGLAAVSEGNRLYGYIDRHGNYVVQPRFAAAGDFVEGLAPASTDGTAFGFIDRSGSWVVTPAFSGVQHYSGGVALVYLSDASGVVAKRHGHQCKYLPWRPFLKTTKEFVDKHGKLIVRQLYEDARNFEDGMAAVKIKGKWGYLALDAAPR